MDLFNNDEGFLPPLADRLRPKDISGFIGQKHLIGEGKPLRQMIDSKFIRSMILWGPPGSGKTTLAGIIAGALHYDFYSISAVLAGVKELREFIAKADESIRLYQKPVMLFIDEIHRFNKSQQDLLLHSIENGSLILIGATTENPSFEINSPILSRASVFTLEPLSDEDLSRVIDRALKTDEVLKNKNIKIDDGGREALIKYSGRDARILLNALEIAVNLGEAKNETLLKSETIKEAYLRKPRYDKTGEEHYNTISAFIKSMRGSDPDGALFWLARMLESGEDIKFIARRMIILASEDIGNADPQALVTAVSCFNAVNVVGMPEARIILAQAATYLASCPKSNASYMGIEEAMSDAQNHPGAQVPLHLRNAPTKLMKNLGYHKGYRYDHGYEEHFAKQSFLPDELKKKVYYRPASMGKEKEIKERLKSLWGKDKDYGE